jgi:hypothetical protein
VRRKSSVGEKVEEGREHRQQKKAQSRKGRKSHLEEGNGGSWTHRTGSKKQGKLEPHNRKNEVRRVK